MNREIKYCLIGAITTFMVSAVLSYFEMAPMLITLVKIVYVAFTLGLVYYVIKLLTTAEVKENN